MSCWSMAVFRDTCLAPKSKPSTRSTSRTKSLCWMWNRRSVCWSQAVSLDSAFLSLQCVTLFYVLNADHEGPEDCWFCPPHGVHRSNQHSYPGTEKHLVKRLAHQLKLANSLLPVSQTENLQMIQKESEAILNTYRQYFDVVLINNDVNESVRIVEEALERATTTPQWVPVSWVYWRAASHQSCPFVETQCNMTFQMKRVRRVTGMWGFVSGFNHHLGILHKENLKKAICLWSTSGETHWRELFIWLFRHLCFRPFRVRQIIGTSRQCGNLQNKTTTVNDILLLKKCSFWN